MRSQEQVWALFVESNPIPNVEEDVVIPNGGARYLTSLAERVDEDGEAEEPPVLTPERRRTVLVAAAVFVVAIVAALLINTFAAPEQPPVTQQPPTTISTETTVTTSTLPSTTSTLGLVRDPVGEAAAIDVALGALETFNSGDVETWVDLRYRGSVDSEVFRDRNIGLLRRQTQAYVAANAQYTNLDCHSEGFSEWKVPDAGPAPGYLVVCDGVLVDDWFGAGGLQLEETFDFLVNDGEVVATTSDTLNPEIWSFTIDFASWLEETHPEVTGALFVLDLDGSPDYPDATFLDTALQFVGEFVASRE